MSFRIIHYEGTKESLLNRLKNTSDMLKNEYKEAYWGNYWQESVDKVAKGDFTDVEAAADVLAKSRYNCWEAARKSLRFRGRSGSFR